MTFLWVDDEYQLQGPKTFVGPVDPVTEGFAVVDGDQWTDTGDPEPPPDPPAEFDPVTMGWHTCLLAAGVDGNPVTSLPDVSGNGHHATPSGGTFTFHDGPRPYIEGTGSGVLLTPTFASLAGPLSLVVIGQATATGTQEFVDGGGNAGNTNRFTVYRRSTGNWGAYAGAELVGGTADGNRHVLRAYVTDSGTGDHLAVDGSVVASGNGGTTGLPITRLALFANSTGASPLTGKIEFVGLYQGQITEHAHWADFQAWAA